MKIRNKINLSFFTIFVIGILLVGVGFEIYANNLVKGDINAYLISSNRARAEHIRTYIQQKEIAAVILASASVYLDFLKEPTTSNQYRVIKDKVDKRLTRTLLADPGLHSTLVIDKTGKIVASSIESEVGLDKSRDDYFVNATSGVYFKSIYVSTQVKGFAYAISAPILDSDGTFLGVSVLRYYSNDFYAMVFNENGLGKTEENFLINSDRFFITPSIFLVGQVILKQKVETQNSINCFDPAEMAYVKTNGYSGLAKIEKHSRILQATDYRGVQVVGTHAYIPETGWCLITKADVSEIFSYRFNLIIFIVVACLIIVLLLLVMGNILAGRITKPLSVLSHFTNKVKNGDFNFKIDFKAKDEIGDLANSFNLMVTAIKKAKAEIDQKVQEQTKELLARQQDAINQKGAILNILEDVEEEKVKAEQVAAIVRDAEEPIISKDLSGIITGWNNGAVNLYGYTAAEVIGKSIKIIVPPEKYSEIEGISVMIGRGHPVEHFATVRKKKDGSLVEVSISASPIKNAAGKVIGVSVISMDITKERQIDKAKTEFVSLASHQLRTPLSAINWYAEMLLDGDAGKLTAEQKDYIKEIYRGNQRMVELVNTLLNVSRLELGTFVIEPQPTDLKLLSEEVVKEQLVGINEKKLSFTATYADDLPQVNVDPKLMRMIFQNYLSNAVKYTPEKGKIKLSMTWDKKGILFSVEDTGYGIPKCQQEKIFQKLFRADNVKSMDTEGTGLGLYIVKEIMDEVKGKAWFESHENKGSKFYILLPLAGMEAKGKAK